MNILFSNYDSISQIKSKRLVFQGGMDKAPKAPENFKSPEKQSEAAMLSEVASQTPSEIYSDTVSAGGAIAARHTQNTTMLAGLATANPLPPGNSSRGGSTGTGADPNATTDNTGTDSTPPTAG